MEKLVSSIIAATVRRCCHLASRPLYFQPRFPIDRLPVSFSLQPQEPLHKWPCPSFKITLETTDNDHQGRRRRASPPPLDSLPSQDSTSFSLSRLLSSPFLIERDTDILDPPTPLLTLSWNSWVAPVRRPCHAPRAI